MSRDIRTREELRDLPVFDAFVDGPAFESLNMHELRLVARLLEHAGGLGQVTETLVREVSENFVSRLARILSGMSRLVGVKHPASIAVATVLAEARKVARATNGATARGCASIREITLVSEFQEYSSVLSLTPAQLRATERLRRQCETIDQIAEEVILKMWSAVPTDIIHLRSTFRKVLGDDHPATIAVMLFHYKKTNQADAKRDARPRSLILAGPSWKKLCENPAVLSVPMDQLRAMDRFFSYCSDKGLSNITASHAIEFSEEVVCAGLLQRLRDGLRSVYGQEHPIVHAAEDARSAKSKVYYLSTGPKPTVGQGKRPRKYSIPANELPTHWLAVLTRLEAGESVQGRRPALASVTNMRVQACNLLWAARREDLVEGFSLETLQAYDRALDARGTRASTRSISFRWLRMLGSYIGVDDNILGHVRAVAAFYDRLASLDLPIKEDRLASLPELAAIFQQASGLLEKAKTETHSTQRATLYTDAGALTLLSLIPFRNQDTVLFWGKHMTYRDGCYHLNKSITKTSATFSGKLHHILNPFIDALILRGRHEAFLPQLREASIAEEAPVFPKSNGAARSVNGLSQRWKKRVGTGSVINRTRIHTLLGELGPEGVRAALSLCAQRSYRTSEHYQADSLARNEMRDSQALLNAALPLSDKELEQRIEGL